MELETETTIFAAPRRTVEYSFVIDNVPAGTLYTTLYLKPNNGGWSINAADNGVNNKAIFTLQTVTENTPNGDLRIAKIKTATNLALVQNLPELLAIKIRALNPDKPAEFDDAVVTEAKINLNIDSDNDNAFRMPNNSALEEFLEDHPYGLGKLVMQNFAPCPNPADSFTPLRIYLHLPQGVNINDVNLKIRLNYFPAGLAGSINLWKVNKNQRQPSDMPLDFHATHSLDELNYDSNTGTINLFVAGNLESVHTKWKNVEQNGRPDAFITATVVLDGTDICWDEVKYLVVQDPSFFHRLQSGKGNMTAQHLRCLLACKGIYDREDLKRFSLKLLDEQELSELGLDDKYVDILSKKHSTSWWNFANQIYGFNAGIYRDYISQKYILAFAGTEPTQVAHWLENIWQGLGNAITQGQYVTAMEIADAIRTMKDPPGTDAITKPSLKDNLIITGHSLGGGLAGAASVVSGRSCVTFNAAGLHRDTLNSAPVQAQPDAFWNFDSNAGALIKAYHVDYDILTQMQNLFSPLIPKAIGFQIELDGDQDFNFIAVEAALVAARLLATPPFTPLAIVLGVGAVGFGAFAGYKCHTLIRLLYGFLVKESSTGLAIDEDLLGLPI